MTQTIANPNTKKKLAKQPVWRAFITPANWTLRKTVEEMKGKQTKEGTPCRFILITHNNKNSFFVFGTDEWERENNEPFMCLVPEQELIDEWNRTRFVDEG